MFVVVIQQIEDEIERLQKLLEQVRTTIRSEEQLEGAVPKRNASRKGAAKKNVASKKAPVALEPKRRGRPKKSAEPAEAKFHRRQHCNEASSEEDGDQSRRHGQGSSTSRGSSPGQSGTWSEATATKMTKTQLIRFMAEQMDVPPKQVGQFFDLLIETATAQTKKLGEFTIPGLGKLVKAQRAARMGRNPATGEALKIKAKTTVKFRLSKTAKDAVVPPRP